MTGLGFFGSPRPSTHRGPICYFSGARGPSMLLFSSFPRDSLRADAWGSFTDNNQSSCDVTFSYTRDLGFSQKNPKCKNRQPVPCTGRGTNHKTPPAGARQTRGVGFILSVTNKPVFVGMSQQPHGWHTFCTSKTNRWMIDDVCRLPGHNMLKSTSSKAHGMLNGERAGVKVFH